MNWYSWRWVSKAFIYFRFPLPERSMKKVDRFSKTVNRIFYIRFSAGSQPVFETKRGEQLSLQLYVV